jgi:HK97 family phage portal protein
MNANDKPTVSRLEWLAYRAGRIKQMYSVGISTAIRGGGARPDYSDNSAWNTGRYWGTDLMNMKSKTKEDFIQNEFTSWVYTCINLNGNTCAAVPWHLYTTKETPGQKFTTCRTKSINRPRRKWLESNPNLVVKMENSADVDEITDHPLIDLLINPNPWIEASDLWYMTIVDMDLTGEAYWWIPPDKTLGVPTEIWPVCAQYINPIPDASAFIKGYIYERGRAKHEFPPEEIIYFRRPNPRNFFSGFGPVQGISDAIYTNRELYELEEALFANRANVGGVLELGENVSAVERDRLAETFSQRYQGNAKAGKTAILPPDVKFVKTTMTMQEMANVDWRKLNREEICAALDVNISVLTAQGVSRSNAEVGDYRHAKNGILPRLRKLEEKINQSLCPLFDEKIFLSFSDPVPANRELEMNERKTYTAAGILAINEARADLGEEPVDGGDDPLVSNLMVPLSSITANAVPNPEMAQEEEETLAENLARSAMDIIKERLGA